MTVMLNITVTNLPYKGNFRAGKPEAYRIFLKKKKSNRKKCERKKKNTTIKCSKAGESFQGNLQGFWRTVSIYLARRFPQVSR